LAYSLWGSISFYVSILLLHNFKTKSVLDFRGVFMAIHQYQWSIKYSCIFFLIILFFSTIMDIVAVLELANVRVPNKLVLFCYTGFSAGSLFLIWRFATIWGELLPYWQDYHYTCWGDDYWAHTSPFLRDYIYWKPIPPEDDEEPKPYYFSLMKRASTRYALYFYYVYLVAGSFFVVDLFEGLPAFFKLAAFKLLFFVTVWHSFNYVVNLDFSGPQAHLYDFAFYESFSHAMYGIIFFCTIYYYFYFCFDDWDFGILSFLLD
jgi:hypothetical protein